LSQIFPLLNGSQPSFGLFVLTYIGMAVSLFPMIVPYQLTLWEAASSIGPTEVLHVAKISKRYMQT
jgi:cytochrome bd-type quinol oxidase subunit 2